MPKNVHVLSVPKEMISNPLLSIAVPTYRRPVLLKEAVLSALDLKFEFPVEILIVDNDPETSADILNDSDVDSSRIFYYKNQENIGMVPNWNHCLSLAKGKYVTILHDDDLLSATFSRCVNRLLLEGELPSEMLGFHVDILDFRFPGADQKKRSVMMPEVIGNLSNESAFFEMKARSIIEFFFGNPFCGTLGIVMDRSKALEIGGFIPSWYPISDYEFWCRWICKCGPISIIPQRVGLYRIQENESFRLDVQSSFVEMSTKLRLLLLLNGEVPSFFKYLIGNLAVVQLHYIRSFWDLKYQKPSLFLSDFFLRKWHFFESVLFFFYRKYTRTPQRK